MASYEKYFELNTEECTHDDFLEDYKLMLSSVTNTADGRPKYEFLWIIDNYDKIELGNLYQGHHIIIGQEKHYLCLQRIRLDNKSKSNSNKFEVKIAMKLLPNAKSNVTLNFSVMDYSKKVYFCNSYLKDYYAVDEEPYLTVNAKLQVICSVTLDENMAIDIHQPITNLKNYISLSEDLDGLLIGGEYSDVKIIVERQEFNAHRCILALRSSVFARMLEVDMIEKNQGRIVIEDCPGSIFHEFLMYLYSGKAKISSVDSAIKLLELGEKYCINLLKLEASTYLSLSLTIDNVIDIYKLSDLYSLPQLKTEAIQFISLNLLEVMKNPFWESIQVNNSLMDSLQPIVSKRTAEKNFEVCFEDYRPAYQPSVNDLELDLLMERNKGTCAFGICGCEDDSEAGLIRRGLLKTLADEAMELEEERLESEHTGATAITPGAQNKGNNIFAKIFKSLTKNVRNPNDK